MKCNAPNHQGTPDITLERRNEAIAGVATLPWLRELPARVPDKGARACLDWPAGHPMVESRPLGGVMKLVNIADLKSAA